MRLLLCILSCFALFSAQSATAEVLSATDKVVEKFMQLDTNGSKSVSFAEYKRMVLQRLDSRFSAMDNNQDGHVSEPEYRNFWVKQQARYYRPKR